MKESEWWSDECCLYVIIRVMRESWDNTSRSWEERKIKRRKIKGRKIKDKRKEEKENAPIALTNVERLQIMVQSEGTFAYWNSRRERCRRRIHHTRSWIQLLQLLQMTRFWIQMTRFWIFWIFWTIFIFFIFWIKMVLNVFHVLTNFNHLDHVLFRDRVLWIQKIQDRVIWIQDRVIWIQTRVLV